jgi:hypothetical protein
VSTLENLAEEHVFTADFSHWNAFNKQRSSRLSKPMTALSGRSQQTSSKHAAFFKYNSAWSMHPTNLQSMTTSQHSHTWGLANYFLLMYILHSSKKANSSSLQAEMTPMILQDSCYKCIQSRGEAYCWSRKSTIESENYCWALPQKSVNNVTAALVTSLLLFC